LGNFQEKSTRYITFGKEGLIFPDQIKNSKYGNEIVDIMHRLIDVYELYSPIVKNVLDEHNVLHKEEFSSEKAYDSTLNAKVFDIMRYALPCNVSTSL
jgi:thymidylate synthase ThyX